MSDKKLAVLGLIAVIMAGAAVLQNRIAKQTSIAEFSTSPLIAGLEIEIVNEISITNPKDSTAVKLGKQNGRFVVADKDNYPADVTVINQLINSCLDIRTTGKITSNPANHADLKVTEETAQYVVSFLADAENPIVTILLSETDMESNRAYARLLSSDDVYSIDRPPFINAGPMDYIDALLVEVAADQLQSVAVNTSEDVYILSSPEGSDEIKMETLPEGKQYKDTVYKTVFNAVNSVRFEDVLSAQNAPADLSFDYVYTCKQYDLTVYKFVLAKQDDKFFAKVTADYLDHTPVEKTVGQVESEEELKKKEAKLLAIDKVKAFNAKHQNWIYQIPAYKAENMTKALSELLEDIPAEEESTDTAAAETAPMQIEG